MALIKKVFIVTLILTTNFVALQGRLPESWQEAQETLKKTAYSAKRVFSDTLKNLRFTQSYAEKYPGRTAFAQFCYAHPVVSSAFVNGLGFLALKRYTQRILRNKKVILVSYPMYRQQWALWASVK